MTEPTTMIDIPKPARERITNISALTESLKNIVVDSTESYANAAAFVSDAKARRKNIEADKSAITKNITALQNQIRAFFSPPLEALEAAIRITESKMIAYHNEQSRIQREAEAKAEAEARKMRERLEEQARQAEIKGKPEKAALLKETAAAIPSAPQVAQVVPQAQGFSLRTTYSAEVYDKMALIEAVAQGRASSAFLEPNMPSLNKQATSLKEEMKIPGVKLVKKQGSVSRDAA